MTNLLVDFDILVYQASLNAQDDFSWGDSQTNNVNKEQAIRYMNKFVDDLYIKFGQDSKIYGCLSDSVNFRKQLCSTYKCNRAEKAKPILYSFCREYIQENFKCSIFPRLEGDDVLAIMATSSKLKGKKIICTLDKDLIQVGTPVWDFKNNKFKEPNPDFFWYQILAGDPTDGFYGVKGIGLKKAQKLLEEVPIKERWKIIVDTYESKGMTEEDALMNARMAYMLRDKDYNRKTHKIKLWKPPV